MNELLNKKILLVDDEPELLKTIADALYREGFYSVYTAADCKQALAIARSQSIALLLLDVNLPDGSGFALFNSIRAFSAAPAIFLTARGEEADRVLGLDLGADDYIVKPFFMKELILRIYALLRRSYATAAGENGFRLGRRYIDYGTASVKLEDSAQPLTAMELTLLKKLYENRGRIVTYDSLCMTAWGEEYYGHENSLTVHIRRLREKLEDNPSQPQYLLTVRGLGYKLVTADE
ncbi:MAG: response regulator transcription factor [Candidatus Limivicinus sp.]|nr:response regulator transcription factor [Candidatus Limivicinus sp.]